MSICFYCGCLQAFLLCVHALEFELLLVWFLHCGYQGHQSIDVELWLKMRLPPSTAYNTCISQPSSSAASSRPVRPQASSASHASPSPSSFGSRSCSFSIANCFSYRFSSCFIRTSHQSQHPTRQSSRANTSQTCPRYSSIDSALQSLMLTMSHESDWLKKGGRKATEIHQFAA